MQRFYKTQFLYQTVPSENEDKLGLSENHKKESFWVDAVMDLNSITNFQDCSQNENLFEEPDYEKFTKNATLVYFGSDNNTVNIPFAEFCKLMGVE